MSEPRVTFIASLLIAAGLLWPAIVEAHDFEPERQLLVQVFPGHVDVLVMYTEAPDERSAFFNAQFRFSTTGAAAELLDELAGRAILPRVLDGLEFEVVGERPRTTEPEVKVEDVDGRVMAAAFVRYELEELGEGQERVFAVRAADRSFLPTRAVVYGGGGLLLADEDDGDVLDFQLFRGVEEQIRFVR